MRGVQQAKRTVIEFIEAELPAFLDKVEPQWGVTVPRPRKYLPNEPSALDVFPLIAVSGVRMPSLRRREYDAEAPAHVYDTTYSLRVFCWIKAQGVDAAVTQRDNLTTAIRTLLVARPSLGVADESVLIDEDSLLEEYSEPTPVKGDRVVTGSFVGVDVMCVERLLADTLGTVETTPVRAGLLPHPALD